MPITITLHIFGYTVTIRIKGRNRHSAPSDGFYSFAVVTQLG